MSLFRLNFDTLPVNTLVGADRRTFREVTRGAEIDPSCRGKYRLTRLVRGMLDPFYRINERRYERLPERTDLEPPVFIIGHWRSGTTYAHNLLSCDDHFGCCSTYQTVFPHLMLWGRPFFERCMAAVMPSSRPTDSMRLGVELPQEEEFALSNMTPCSHYHFWMFPHRMAEYRERFLTFERASECEREEFLAAQDKVMRIALQVSGRRQFLSKNPPHTGRVAMLLKRYPQARFIYLVRNPYVVYESTHNFFRQTIDAVGMQRITDEALDREILLNYRALYESYESARGAIPEGQLFEVRFEDLQESPLEIVELIYDRLSLGDFQQVRPAMERYLATLRGYRKKHYEFDSRTIERVESHWGDALREWNYRL